MKIVTLKVVVKDELVEVVSKEFEKSSLSQEGVYTLDCGSISELNESEMEEVVSQIPDNYLD